MNLGGNRRRRTIKGLGDNAGTYGVPFTGLTDSSIGKLLVERSVFAVGIVPMKYKAIWLLIYQKKLYRGGFFSLGSFM